MGTSAWRLTDYFTQLDPRYYQLWVQLSLLVWGWVSLEFPIHLISACTAIAVSLMTQWLFLRLYRQPLQFLSAVNTSLSLVLLLQVNSWLWMAMAAFIAISSKFLLRWQNRHIFNPSNIGIVTTLLLTNSAWVASGRWGHGLWLFLLLAGLGLVWRLGWRVMITSLVFLSLYSSLLMVRTLWLGDPWSIPLHQLQNGALLIFSFFMLSDPMTTPTSFYGRILFGSWVALLSWALQFTWYLPNAFLYALALAAPLGVLINHFWQGHPYQWPKRS